MLSLTGVATLENVLLNSKTRLDGLFRELEEAKDRLGSQERELEQARSRAKEAEEKHAQLQSLADKHKHYGDTAAAAAGQHGDKAKVCAHKHIPVLSCASQLMLNL